MVCVSEEIQQISANLSICQQALTSYSFTFRKLFSNIPGERGYGLLMKGFIRFNEKQNMTTKLTWRRCHPTFLWRCYGPPFPEREKNVRWTFPLILGGFCTLSTMIEHLSYRLPAEGKWQSIKKRGRKYRPRGLHEMYRKWGNKKCTAPGKWESW